MRLQDEIRRAGSVEFLSQELIERCTVSQGARKDEARKWRTLATTGTLDGKQSRVNLCENFVDKLASLLFSPSDVIFEVGFDTDESEEWDNAADIASRYVNRRFKSSRCNIAFSLALEIALVEQSSFIKLTWDRRGYKPHIIRQQFIGVEREDLNDLDDQEVFTHTFYLTPDSFWRLIRHKPNARQIMSRVQGSFSARSAEEVGIDVAAGSFLHDIVVGGNSPIGSITGSGSQGSVGVFGPSLPMLAPAVADRLIAVTDIWLLNDEAHDGTGAWATIRYCDPGIVIEGEHMIRNLGDIPDEHPFLKVSPNEQPGYFWGRSQLASVWFNQQWFSDRAGNVDDIFALRARPPRSFTGFSGLTPEKMRALLTRGGTFTDDAPTGKIESHAPEMPPEALQYLQWIHGSFDEAGGMNNALSGEGQAGVRSGSHASQNLRVSTPRLRDKATSLESQVSEFGDLCFDMSKAKDARVFKTQKGREFMLSQLPEDAMVEVDSHSSSPAFSGDNVQLAFALARSQAIDGEDLLAMTQPPHVDRLIQKYRKRQEQQQQFLAQHPELLEKGKKK